MASLVSSLVGNLENPGRAAARALYPVKTPSTHLGKAAEAILKASERWHINPAYLWGIYGTETSFGSAINVSSTGARGPFQFEPATAKQYGYPLGVNEHSITSWAAFQQQADAAARFLYAHGGSTNIKKAVESYNPGEASYYSKVVQHAKSFSKSFATEGENKAEAAAVNAPSSSGTAGLVAEIFAKIGTLALSSILLITGAVLVAYGIMVAVRPRERALSIPLPAAV